MCGRVHTAPPLPARFWARPHNLSLSFPVCYLRKQKAPAWQEFVRIRRAGMWSLGCVWHSPPHTGSNDRPAQPQPQATRAWGRGGMHRVAYQVASKGTSNSQHCRSQANRRQDAGAYPPLQDNQAQSRWLSPPGRVQSPWPGAVSSEHLLLGQSLPSPARASVGEHTHAGAQTGQSAGSPGLVGGCSRGSLSAGQGCGQGPVTWLGPGGQRSPLGVSPGPQAAPISPQYG